MTVKALFISLVGVDEYAGINNCLSLCMAMWQSSRISMHSLWINGWLVTPCTYVTDTFVVGAKVTVNRRNTHRSTACRDKTIAKGIVMFADR